MRSLVKLLASGAVALSVLAPGLAQAATVHVTFTIIGSGLDVKGSWDQDSNPVPAGPSSPPAVVGQYTDILISNYKSTGTTPTPIYTDVVWSEYPTYGGGFTLYSPSGSLDYSVLGPQAYTGPETAPIFGDGSYTGTEFFSNAPATYTLTVSTTPAPGPTPGAGLASLAALALAGLYMRTRRA
jgi:hypothetical protein